jgi:hypothetical protein
VTNSGLLITSIFPDQIKQNENYTFFWYVQNQTNSAFLNNTGISCALEIYKSSGLNGLHQVSIGGTFDGVEEYYAFIDKENFTTTGEYIERVKCNSTIYSGIGGIVDNTFIVTPTGELLDQPISNIFIIIILALLLVFGITVYGAIKMPFKNNRNEDDSVISINNLKYLKIVLWFFAYLEFLFIIFIIKNLTYGSLILNSSYQFFNIVYFMLLIGLIPALPLLIWITIAVWLNDKRTQEDLERGILPQ